MKKFIGFLILVLCPTFLYASPPSVLGGKMMPAGSAHMIGAGWPSLTYEWWNSGTPNWALGVELVYGDWVSEFSNLEIGAAFNFPMRWRVMQRGRVAMAFRFSPGVMVGGVDTGPNDKVSLGARGELGLPMTIQVHHQVNIITGLNVPLALLWVDGTDPFVAVPILARFGVEVAPIPEVNPFLLFELGPAMAFGDFGSEVEFGFRVWIGTTFW